MVATAAAERVWEGAVAGGTIEMIGCGSKPAPKIIRRHDSDASGPSPPRPANTAAPHTHAPVAPARPRANSAISRVNLRHKKSVTFYWRRISTPCPAGSQIDWSRGSGESEPSAGDTSRADG